MSEVSNWSEKVDKNCNGRGYVSRPKSIVKFYTVHRFSKAVFNRVRLCRCLPCEITIYFLDLCQGICLFVGQVQGWYAEVSIVVLLRVGTLRFQLLSCTWLVL